MIEPDNLTPPPPKKHFGRFLLWAALVGGLCLFLFLVLLVAVTTPNLRREAAPPEISGPKQRERLSGASDSPTSKALPPSGGVTSGTHPLLNLDEFPYLSPKMRELAQAWLDQSAETDRALDSVADPVLHARIAAFLKGRGAKMRTFLNFPLEWGDQPFQKTLDALALYRFSNRDETDTEAWKQILLQCPEFADVFEKERGRSSVLKFRLSFEFCAERQHWNSAAEWCAAADRMSHLDYPDLAPLRDMNGWDEEIYCWRQMGPTGLAALTAR
ncbi:MAG TPA: hypothetical protein PKH31_16860, partial [Candidatus Sumerlaeota bacterium]|nr:hypothetical protein [Candidatus Sumerlaeota bacterium]